MGLQSTLDRANADRRDRAAEETVTAVRAALDQLGAACPARLREAGQLRLDHPKLSLTDLGLACDPPVTKHVIAGLLRRLLRLANRTTP